MSGPWPSDRLSAGRASKAPKAKAYPVDWLSGWLVLLLTVAVPAIVLLFLWPVAATALESIQQLTDALQDAPALRHELVSK
jgi:cytochrome c-type biogenesis protein CcmH/NrfG